MICVARGPLTPMGAAGRTRLRRSGRAADAARAGHRRHAATRSILAAVLCEEGTKAVDAALRLAEMAVPHPLRPTWPAALAIAHASLPYQRLLTLDQRLEHAAARPVVVPETIVVDRGAPRRRARAASASTTAPTTAPA